MKKRVFYSCILTLMMLFIASEDAFAKRPRQYDCAGRIARAIKYYNKKRWGDVKTVLDEVKINCSGYSALDTALYYLGKANMAMKQYAPASLEFEVFLQDYPHSPFAREVHFLIGQCKLKEASTYERDQTKTKEAIRELEDFLELYPEGQYADSAKRSIDEGMDKLVKKEVMNARFYEKIQQYDAAITYYTIIINDFPGSSYIGESKIALARNFYKVSRPKDATALLNELISSDIDDETKEKAKTLLNRIEKGDVIKLREPRPEKAAKDDTSLKK